MSGANVLKHFHKLPGSLPAQLSWPLLWAACPYRLQPHEGLYCLFQTLYLHDNPPEQTLQRTKSPCNTQTSPGVRYMATHGTWTSWNGCFETSCKMWGTERTIIPSTLLLHRKIDSSNPTGWKAEKVWKNPTQQKSSSKSVCWERSKFFKLELKKKA